MREVHALLRDLHTYQNDRATREKLSVWPGLILVMAMRIRPEFKGAIVALASMLVLVLAAWAGIGLRLRIWNYHDYDTYLWVTHGTPVGHGLWWGEIKADDDVGEFIGRYEPYHLTRFGRWARMDWTPGGPLTDSISLVGVCVVAKDGVLVQAAYYSDYGPDNRFFFNRMTSADETDFHAAEYAFVQDLKRGCMNVAPAK